MCGDNAALKGVIMVFVACAPVMTAGPDFRVLSHRERGSRGRGPRLMEAKQPPAPAPAVQKSAFRGKNRPPLGARATRYINTRSNLTPPPPPHFNMHPKKNKNTNLSSSSSLLFRVLNPNQISAARGWFFSFGGGGGVLRMQEEIVVHFLTN